MANIIPMAGLGSRFSSAGFILPKPLIPVSGSPMIIKAIEHLPESDKWIFIVREEHIADYSIDRLIRKKIPGAIIIPVKATTEGQASSCMLALPYLDKNEPVFVASCDNSFVYDRKKFSTLAADLDIDSIVWTFTNNELLRKNPHAWGWVLLEKDNTTVRDVSVKIPVSGNSFLDHAIVAAFYFKKSSQMKAAYDLMIREDYRINNEFYLDAMPIFYKKLKLRSVIFDVDLYVGWGKPEDLYYYQYMEFLCNFGPDGQDKKQDFGLWKKFFDK